jgi:MFS family permease
MPHPVSPFAATIPPNPDVVSTPPPAIDLRQQLAWITTAWVFGTVWLWAISGAAMTQFCRAIGMPDYAFGFLAALPFIGTLIQVPTSYWLERYGHRRPIFLWTAALHRGLWIVAAALPWVLPQRDDLWWQLLIAVLLVSWLLGQASGPAWLNWMSDLIPRRVRGRYFAFRNLITQPIGVVTTIGIGYAVDLGARADDPAMMLNVTAAILAFGGVCGVFDILCFLRVRDDAPPPPQKGVNLFRLMRQPLKDPYFRRYLAFNFTFMLAIGFIGQYVWLYAFDVVGWSNWWANMLLIAIPLLLRMAVVRPWGRLMDRVGKKPVLLITGFFTVFGAVGWLLITPEHFWIGYTLIIITSLAWPGMEIANFNFTLDLAGTRKARSNGQPHGHEREAAGTACVALNSMAIALGGVLSGLLGAAIAATFADLHHAVGFMGIVITYHSLLFILTTLLRLAAMGWAIGLHEPRATGTRDAIRYMTGGLYSNVRQAVMMPSRMVGHVVRSSYRIGR